MFEFRSIIRCPLISIMALVACASSTEVDRTEEPLETSKAEPYEDTAEAGLEPVETAEALFSRTLGGGQEVTFYEPQPGWIVIRSRVPRDAQRVLGGMGGDDPIEVFSKIFPDEDIPQALSDAASRAAAMVQPDDGQPREAEPGGGGSPADQANSVKELSTSAVNAGSDIGRVQQAHSSSSAAHFVNSHNGCIWGTAGSFCKVNWANGFYSGSQFALQQECIVDHYSGNGVTVRVARTNSGAPGSTTDFSLAAGQIEEYFNACFFSNCSIDLSLEVLNASGDSFHVGCQWWK